MVKLGSGNHVYEASGEDWGSLPEGWGYHEGTAVAVDSKDNAYVFNRGGHPVIVYDREGNFLRSWGEGVFAGMHGISIDPEDSVYCTDHMDHAVRKFTPEGKLLMTLGRAGSSGGPQMSGEPFNRPTHTAVDPRNGDIYVADGYSNARVHKYSPDGKLLFSWGESGTDPGHFNIVHNIAVDQDGWVYVADRENRRIQVFDSEGKFETQWGNLSRAAGVCLGPAGSGLVYVGEYFGGQASNSNATRVGPRVTIFNTTGEVQARLSENPSGEEPGRFYAPHALAVDSRGDIYVAEVSFAEYGRHMDPPTDLRSFQKLVKVET